MQTNLARQTFFQRSNVVKPQAMSPSSVRHLSLCQRLDSLLRMCVLCLELSIELMVSVRVIARFIAVICVRLLKSLYGQSHILYSCTRHKNPQ
jgi:hypothetical protein